MRLFKIFSLLMAMGFSALAQDTPYARYATPAELVATGTGSTNRGAWVTGATNAFDNYGMVYAFCATCSDATNGTRTVLNGPGGVGRWKAVVIPPAGGWAGGGGGGNLFSTGTPVLPSLFQYVGTSGTNGAPVLLSAIQSSSLLPARVYQKTLITDGGSNVFNILSNITFSSPTYRIRVIATNGTHTGFINMQTDALAFVDIWGESRDGTVLYWNNDTSDTILAANNDNILARFTVIHTNTAGTTKYPIHVDNSGSPSTNILAGGRLFIYDVTMRGVGSNAKSGLGIGTHSGESVFVIDSSVYSQKLRAINSHNQAGAAANVSRIVFWNVTATTDALTPDNVGLLYNNLGSGQADQVIVVGGSYTGTDGGIVYGNSGAGANESWMAIATNVTASSISFSDSSRRLTDIGELPTPNFGTNQYLGPYVATMPNGWFFRHQGSTNILAPLVTGDAIYFAPTNRLTYAYEPSAGQLAVRVNDIESMRVTTLGNVGFGTTAPAAKVAIDGGGLHVGGNTDPGDGSAIFENDFAMDGQAIFGSTDLTLATTGIRIRMSDPNSTIVPTVGQNAITIEDNGNSWLAFINTNTTASFGVRWGTVGTAQQQAVYANGPTQELRLYNGADKVTLSTSALTLSATTDLVANGEADFNDAVTVDAAITLSGILNAPASATQSVSAGTSIAPNAAQIAIDGNGGPITVTATPSVSNGATGAWLLIRGTADATAVTLQDEGTLAGSNLELGGATTSITLGFQDYALFFWNAPVTSQWVLFHFHNDGATPGTVTSVSTGDVGGMFDAAVATATTTPALSFTPIDQGETAAFGWDNTANVFTNFLFGTGLTYTSATRTLSGNVGTVTSFSSGDIGGVFTANVATATSTPALTFTAIDQNETALFGWDNTANTFTNVLIGSGLSYTSATRTLAATGGSGTVTSIGIALEGGSGDEIYSVTGSPVTTSGNIAMGLNDQVQKTFFAGPTSGGDDSPTFRAIELTDLPSIGSDTIYGSDGGGTPTALTVTSPIQITGGALNISAVDGTAITKSLDANPLNATALFTVSLPSAGMSGVWITGTVQVSDSTPEYQSYTFSADIAVVNKSGTFSQDVTQSAGAFGGSSGGMVPIVTVTDNGSNTYTVNLTHGTTLMGTITAVFKYSIKNNTGHTITPL